MQIEGKWRKKERQLRKQNKEVDDAIEEEIQQMIGAEKPSFKQLLPIAIVLGIVNFCAYSLSLHTQPQSVAVTSIPRKMRERREEAEARRIEAERAVAEEEEMARRAAQAAAQREEERKVAYEVATNIKPVSNMKTVASEVRVREVVK